MSARTADFYQNWGFLYWNPFFYRAILKAIRSKDPNAMYRTVAQEIGGLSTLDLCCGYGELRRWTANGDYIGIDKNPAFLRHLRKKCIAAIEGDLSDVVWPPAECLVIVDSLYHFLPDIDSVMSKIMAYPFRKLIVSEPIENLSHSSWTWLSRFAVWATRVDGQRHPHRFDEQTLRSFFARYRFGRVTKSCRNLVGVLDRA